MQRVTIDCSRIRDRRSFHDVFAEALGFPEFYGRNMDAWIDCVSDLDQGSGLTNVRLSVGETLLLELRGASGFHARMPELSRLLLECVAIVNGRSGDDAGVPRPTALVAVAWA
ncbi:MAG: barstar family protein [Planctomycetota bacterium]